METTLPLVLGLGAWAVLLASCHSGNGEGLGAAWSERTDDRRQLVSELAQQGIRDTRVLAAMERVPRHAFVPDDLAGAAYLNQALPIGSDQTISQPWVVAAMSAALELDGDERVLEVGTGSGYQAAVLAELAREVHSIEILPELAERAAGVLRELGYGEALHLHVGDGYAGVPGHAPFDAILVTAAPPAVPVALLDQLAPGGRLVAPIGQQGAVQELRLITKAADGTLTSRSLGNVRFVPMTRGER